MPLDYHERKGPKEPLMHQFSQTKANKETVHPTSKDFSKIPPFIAGNSNASLISNTADACRICHCEGEIDAPLISPCECLGSLRYVHQACLQQWIKSANTKSCELCKHDFHMTTKVKPFQKWQKLEMSTMERRKIICSVTFHVIAITCVIWSLYVLIDRTTEEIRAGIWGWPFWTKLIVVAVGFTGGLVFMYVQCKMYVHYCKRWRAYNRVIYVQNFAKIDETIALRNDENIETQTSTQETEMG